MKSFNYFDPTPDFSSQASQKRYTSTKNYIMRGLNLEAVCKNHKCMENGKKKLVPMGFGTFHWDELIHNTKCNWCPERALGINPAMLVVELKFVKCLWRYNGHAADRNGFVGTEFSKKDFIVNDYDNVQLQEIVQGKNWRDLEIFCKGL